MATKRASQPPYSARRVFVRAADTPDASTYVIRDEGPGFDPTKLPDPLDPENLEKVSGRGVLLIGHSQGAGHLTNLLQAEIAQHRVPVSSLCIAAAVPATTALRWIKTMTEAGLFKRRADPHDGRRVFVELSPKASEAMRRYFSEVGKVAVI